MFNFTPQIHTTKHSSTDEAVAHAIQDLVSLCNSHTNGTDATPSRDTVGCSGDVSDSGEGQHWRKGLVYVELTCPPYPEDSDSRSGDYPKTDEDRSDGGYDSAGYNSDQGHGHGDGEGAEGRVDRTFDRQGSGGNGSERSPQSPLAQVDSMAQQLYGAAPEGTLLVVVTQGSMQAMKLLASRKTR